MTWVSQNWFFLVFGVFFVMMHLGHGGHGGHAAQSGAARIESVNEKDVNAARNDRDTDRPVGHHH